jgi:hypothetical protein
MGIIPELAVTIINRLAEDDRTSDKTVLLEWVKK